LTATLTRTKVALAAWAIAVLAIAGSAVPASSADAVESSSAPRALAQISGSQFRAGNIISDSLFYDSKAMTAAEIQTFLNAKVGKCSNGRCLNVMAVSAASQPAYISDNTGNRVCTAVTGGTMSVAAWIYRVQVACGISAKVILVTLQKEQGLVTSKAPSDYALNYAMGMGCPDTTGCTYAPAGLATQIYRGTRQLMIYKASRFGKQPGVQQIRYSPNARCGGSTVNVANYATAALYNYTPYQPNAAALANLTGTGDSCSSYGNRNFWYYYTTWFGSTQGAALGWIDSGAGVYGVTDTGELRLYGGNGKGGWKALSTLAETGWGGQKHVFGAGDFDGDGHRDILRVDATGKLWVHSSDGIAELQPAKQVPGDWSDYDILFSPGDFNSDGHSDLISRGSDGTLRLHPGNGIGGVGAPVVIGTGYQILDLITGVGDFSGDGRPDYIGRDLQGRLWLYRGTGTGGIVQRTQIGTGWGPLDIVGPGDFTGDKRNDLLARNAAGQMLLYAGTGTGRVVSGKVVGTGWTMIETVASPGPMPTRPVIRRTGAGDLTGDGKRDILARDATGVLWTYPGAGAGKFLSRIRASASWGDVTSTTGVDDFDGDGIQDILARHADGTMWLYPSNRKGGFGTPRQVGTGWGEYTAILGAGDLTSDRIGDVVARDAAGALWMYAGDGAGGFAPRVKVGTGWNGLTIIAPGDTDADHIGDLITIDAEGDMRIYRGGGSGNWASPEKFNVGWTIFDHVFSPGDFDGDGNPDLVGREPSGKLWLYPGDGRGGLLTRKQIGSGWQSFDYVG
jgi:hypothetical protein